MRLKKFALCVIVAFVTSHSIVFISKEAKAACSFSGNGDFVCDGQTVTVPQGISLIDGASLPQDAEIPSSVFGSGAPIGGLSDYNRIQDLANSLNSAQQLANFGNGASAQQLDDILNKGLTGAQQQLASLADAPKSAEQAAEEAKALQDDGTDGEPKHLSKGSVCDPNKDDPIEKDGKSDHASKAQAANRAGWARDKDDIPLPVSKSDALSGKGRSMEDISGSFQAYDKSGQKENMKYNEKYGQYEIASDLSQNKDAAQQLIDKMKEWGVDPKELDHCLFANLASSDFITPGKLKELMNDPQFQQLITEKKFDEAAEIAKQKYKGEVGEDVARVIKALGGNADNPNGQDLSAARQRIIDELNNNPDLKKEFFDTVERETGSQPGARQAYMESVINRALADNQSLTETIRDPVYYPDRTLNRGSDPYSVPDYQNTLNNVANGSNVCSYCTGNSSGTTGVGNKLMTLDGEHFGIEAYQRHCNWAAAMGYTGACKG